MNLKFNDWQDMALKKDTETIIKKLSNQEPVALSMCWEIVLAIAIIIVDHLFDDKSRIPVWVWIVCAALAILPPVIVILWKASRFLISISRTKAGIYNVKQFVDIFDNKICYWANISKSYNDLINESAQDQITDRIFLFHESSYYINKSINELYKMLPAINIIFSSDINQELKGEVVGVYRLVSVMNKLKNERLNANQSIEDIQSDICVTGQIKLNLRYDNMLTPIADAITNIFNISFAWNVK